MRDEAWAAYVGPLNTGRSIQEFLGRKSADLHQAKNLICVSPIAGIDDHIEAHPAERAVWPKPMDSDVKDVDVFLRQQSGQLMKHPRFVVEPGAESEIATS